jgi:hypothetical protein
MRGFVRLVPMIDTHSRDHADTPQLLDELEVLVDSKVSVVAGATG